MCSLELDMASHKILQVIRSLCIDILCAMLRLYSKLNRFLKTILSEVYPLEQLTPLLYKILYFEVNCCDAETLVLASLKY